jgi:tetratricopeptide (TPR) repeat protein
MALSGTALLTDAERLREEGVAANAGGHPAHGRKLLRRGLRVLTAATAAEADHRQVDRLTARVLLGLAFAEFELHGLERGREILDRASDLARRTDSPDIRVLTYSQRGVMLVRSGHLDESLVELDRAVTLLDHAGNLDRCAILLNRGSLHLYRGDLSAARADLARCAELAKTADLGVLEFKARHNLGYLEFLAGDLPLALDIMTKADSLPVDVSRGVGLLDQAQVLVEAGLITEADETLAVADRLFQAEGATQDRGEVELARAECALLTGDLAAARRFAREARARFRRRASEGWRRRADLLRLQASLASQAQPGRVAESALRLASGPDNRPLDEVGRAATLIAAEAFIGAGHPAQAAAAAATFGRLRPSDRLSTRLQVRLVHAKLALAAGDAALASRRLNSGLAELAEQQGKLGSLDLRTAAAVHGRRLADLDLRIAVDSGRASTVFEVAERSRAMSSRLPNVRPHHDSATAALLTDLRMALEEVRTTAPGQVSIGHRRRIAELQRAIRQRSWTHGGAAAVAKPAAIADVRKMLEKTGSTMLSFFVLDDQLHAVLVGPGILRVQILGSAARTAALVRRCRADIDVLGQSRLPGGLKAAAVGSLQRALTQLDDLLLRAVMPEDVRLVIVASRVLAGLPWGMLPSRRGLPTVVASSATSWLRCVPQRPGGAIGPGDVFAIAGPSVAAADTEVAGVAAQWPQAAIVPASVSTRAALVGGLARHRVVHVAAHGQHNSESPLFSSIQLADGPLFAYELQDTPRMAEHIVLAACELGLATIRPGDEALGLTSVLLQLGARSVVSGVARVADGMTAAVMEEYHARLAGGVDSAQALADACVASTAAGSSPAPFVCFGASWGVSGSASPPSGLQDTGPEESPLQTEPLEEARRQEGTIRFRTDSRIGFGRSVVGP